MNTNKTDVSVVVPVHNEEVLLAGFINDVIKACAKLKLTHELVLVENGSQDKSWKIMQEISRKTKVIKAYRLTDPGYGEAILTGIEKAAGKYMVIFNVDYWDERFLTLTTADILGYDVVLGSKLLPGSTDLRPLNRRIVSFGYNLLLKILFGYGGTDTHGIKVFRRETLLPLIKKCKLRSGIFDSELMIRAYREKLKILELPVTVSELRPARFGKNRILQTPVDIWNLAKALV